MSYTQISGNVIQHMQDNVASLDSYLKFYAASTITPISMSIDAAGSTLLAKSQLNAQGLATNGSSAPFVPYIDQKYRIVLYPNATDANNNTFSNALYDIDNLDQFATADTSTNDTKNRKTIAIAVADTSLEEDDALNLAEHTAGKGGGAMWDVVLLTSVTPNAFNIVQCTGVVTLALVLRLDKVITPEHLGVVADGSIVTTGLQNYADFCIDNDLQFTWGKPQSTGAFYRIDSPLLFSEPCNITAIGKDKGRLACNDCDGIVFTGSTTIPTNITLEKSYIAQNIRHTTTPNSFRAISFEGSTSARPFWNNVNDNFFDGFGIIFDCEWIWSSTFTRNNASNCGTGLRVVGQSVNNDFHHNKIGCNILGISMKDGDNTKEGWNIHHNLIEGSNTGVAIDFIGGGFCKFNDNICDHQGPGTSILFRSGVIQITGHDIKNNYVAFSSAGVTGIRSLNNVPAGSAFKGMTISNNRVFAYPTFSLANGITTDGTNELNNTISGNIVDADTIDCNNSLAVDSNIYGNTWSGAGFSTLILCNYESNVGGINTSVAFLSQSLGNNKEYQASAQPTSGTYVRGDVAINVAPSLDGNGMTIMGWIRLTTGSGNVAGTDWAIMRVSNVSPAT